MNNLVSIIIPAFNYGSYLPECINSLISQKHLDWEAIIVDDGSTDNTNEICRQFTRQDPRIKYLRQQNQGQPAARNTGLACAKGSFIQFLDADDVLQPNKLQLQVNAMMANKAVDIIFTDVFYFQNSPIKQSELILNRWDDPYKPWITKIEGKGEKLVNAYARKNLFELGCALFRKRVLSQLESFDTKLKGVEDYEFCWRAAIQGFQFSYLKGDEGAILMRHHSASFSKNVKRMHQAEIDLRKKIGKKLKSAGFNEAVTINQKQKTARFKKWKNLVISEFRTGKYKPTTQEMLWLFQKSNVFETIDLLARLAKNTPMHYSNNAKSSSHPELTNSHLHSPAENVS